MPLKYHNLFQLSFLQEIIEKSRSSEIQNAARLPRDLSAFNDTLRFTAHGFDAKNHQSLTLRNTSLHFLPLSGFFGCPKCRIECNIDLSDSGNTKC